MGKKILIIEDDPLILEETFIQICWKESESGLKKFCCLKQK
jgi:hypothetical protein